MALTRVTSGGIAEGINLRFGSGTLTNPSFAFTDDTNTGIYKSGTNTFNLISNGSSKLVISSTGVTSPGDLISQIFKAQDGSISAPSFSFVNDANSGIYRDTSDTGIWKLVANSTDIVTIHKTNGFLVGTNIPSNFGGTLTTSGNATFNSNVTLVGSNTINTEFFKITNGSSDKFIVDSFNGNTDISGTLTVSSNTTLNNTTLNGTLSVTGNTSLGNTTLNGTLSTSGNATFNSNVTLVGSNTINTEVFKITDGTSNNKFIVDSFNGNTEISGTLSVTGNTTLGNTTLNGTLSVTGNTTLGNTTLNGTLSTSGNATLNGTLLTSGNATFNSSVLLGTGTTTNPSFAFTGDTNTGIYQRAADMVGIVEGGTGYPVGYRNTPSSGSEKTTAYTLTDADCGKLVTIGTSGSVVVPSGFTAGDIVYLFNNTSGTVNVTKGSIDTLYKSGSNTTQTTITMASRTMAAIQFISSTVAVFFSGAASSSAFTLDYLMIAGGGGGGQGGGGAGGYLNSLTGESYGGGGARAFSIPITPSVTSYTVTVGAGGAAGTNGNVSSFHTIAAVGGGSGVSASNSNGNTGGSGGGGSNGTGTGGAGTINQGYAGGNAAVGASGGGGGAGAVGSNATTTVGGNGGAGLSSSITGTATTRAGGGGGGFGSGGSSGGAGGTGGGGAGVGGSATGTAGTANTGGGGGGRHDGTGGAGGSGVVILRYVTADYSGNRSTTGTVTTSGDYTIITFNSSGTVTFGV